MRLMVVGDLHANGGALDAIDESVDAVVVLGDLVDYGLDPSTAVEWVRTHATWVVRGNHDHAVATGSTTILNPGSVGQPRAGAPLPTYAIWDDGDVFLVHRRYDIGPVVEGLDTRPGSPEHQARFARTLRRGEIATAPAPEGTRGAGAVNGGR